MKEATETVPRAPREIKITPADVARFWARVNKNGPTQPHMNTPCWVWVAGKDRQGYGQFSIGRISFRSHRFAWMIHHGPIPHDGSAHGICVLHRCDNPACIRVDHLFLGTIADNLRDMNDKGRGNCGRGDRHSSRLYPDRVPRGETNGQAKLTDAQIVEIRAYYAGGIKQRDLAAQFGVVQKQISYIVRRKTWNHVP